MKLIRIFLLLIIVSFVVGVGTTFNGKHNEITIDKLNEQILSTEEVNIKTPITELSTEIPTEDKEEKVEEKIIVEKNKELEVEKTSPQIEIKEKQIEQQIETPIKNEEKPIWEELEISEYDYYHKPMWSWGRVDYSIEEYGSESKAREKCVEDGNLLFEQGVPFACTTINSYAGNYLGEMLRTF